MANNPLPKSLSKSRYIAGRQCSKRLWLEVHMPDGKDELSATSQMIFQAGTKVGEIARLLYPDGVLISADYHHRIESLRETRQAIQNGATVLFEAAAEDQGRFCRADILVKVGNQWDLLEVKMGSGHEEEKNEEKKIETYLYDMTAQKVIFEGDGYSIRRTCLVLINRDYVRQGPLDIQRLFVVEDRTEEVMARVEEVRAQLTEYMQIVHENVCPEKEIGTQCSDPYDCPYLGVCFRNVPDYSVFDLRNIRSKKAFQLYHSGKRLPEDVPIDQLSDFQIQQVEVKRTGKTYLDRAAIRDFLEGIQFPVRHMDFETINPAIPIFDGTRPYDRQPFQYSIHLQERRNGELRHYEYLPDHRNDPRREFIEHLLRDLGTEGTILAFNAPFEKGVLKELSALFPDLANPIDAVVARIQDLATPFQKGWVIQNVFKGKYSQKVVLPAINPEMSYAGMNIGDGGSASAAWLEYLAPATLKTRQDAIRGDLLRYCGRDSEGMVAMLNYLFSLI